MPPGVELAGGGGDGHEYIALKQYSTMGDSANMLDVPDEQEKHNPLDQDTYGASLFSIIEDLAELFGGVPSNRPYWFHIMRLLFVHVVLLANYAMQFGMLYFIKYFVVDVANETNAEEEGETMVEMLVRTHPAFLGVILTLWTLTILIEFRKVETFVVAVNSLKSAPALKEMMHEDEDKDGNATLEIKGMTWPVWTIIMLFITLPKILIVCGLFYLGFQWLAATTSPEKLILNALALGFVVNIDEQLFHGLIPQSLMDHMEHCSLTEIKPLYKSREEEVRVQIRMEWQSFRRAIFYLVFPICLSAGYIFWEGRLVADEHS